MSGISAARVVAVIPARGGSKGIPRKNVREIGGIPLIARTIMAAQACAAVDVVAVSSDDDEILSVATAYGALGIRRPEALATDQASSESALLHALDRLEADGAQPELLIFLQCTSPFTSGEDVQGLVDAFADPAIQAALTVSPNHGFLWRHDADGNAIGINHDITQPRQRRQDLPPEYRENGAGYAMRVPAFRAAGTRFCGKTAIVRTDMPSVEIDEPEDLEIVDAMAHARERPKLSPAVANRLKLLVTDFDGVHTDDYVYVADDGREIVRCSRSDGMGVSLLRAAGVRLMILSKEENQVVTRRAEKLKAAVIQGVGEKLSVLNDWLAREALSFDEIAYIGNDLNDLECMAAAAIAFAPADAHPRARAIAVTLGKSGGQGALREACELILHYRD